MRRAAGGGLARRGRGKPDQGSEFEGACILQEMVRSGGLREKLADSALHQENRISSLELVGDI